MCNKIAIGVLLWCSLFIFTFSAASTSDHCDPRIRPDQRTLRSDQLTVLINGYSESRINLLRTIVTAYSTSPIVAAVLILWGNPTTSAETLAQLSKNLTASFYGASAISIIPHSTESLNNRFLPRPSFITTRGVLICDDDIEIDTKSFEFAFKIWSSHQNSLVGFFARSHDLDLTDKNWIYTVHPDKYSIMLTKFMIMKTEYLYKYSCEGGEAMREMREVVERMGNCEDILMNLVVAEATKKGPVLVGAEKARDWGDARNEEGGEGEREVGLSSRRGEHRKRRGECIREFHRVWGKMPLVYSYGKIVSGVGEQGLCIKGGKLMFCDHQI